MCQNVDPYNLRHLHQIYKYTVFSSLLRSWLGVAFCFKKAKYMIHFQLRTLFKCVMVWVPAKSVKVLIICWDLSPSPLCSYINSSEKFYCSQEMREKCGEQQHLSHKIYVDFFFVCVLFMIVWLGYFLLLHCGRSQITVVCQVCHFYPACTSVSYFPMKSIENSSFWCIFLFDNGKKIKRTVNCNSDFVEILFLSLWWQYLRSAKAFCVNPL